MRPLRNKPILIERVSLWWYPLLLVPILVLAWLSFAGVIYSMFAPIALFALFFWIFSFGFAIAGKLKKPPPTDPRP